MINLLNTLHNKKVSFKVDKICSKVGKGDSLSVREAYRVVQPSVDIVFLVKGIWVRCALTKTTFFAWEATWGKVLTLDQLQIRGS